MCGIRRRIGHLFITFAVALHISTSRCCYRLYERSFSDFRANKILRLNLIVKSSMNTIPLIFITTMGQEAMTFV
jgi:hypothetical protein